MEFVNRAECGGSVHNELAGPFAADFCPPSQYHALHWFDAFPAKHYDPRKGAIVELDDEICLCFHVNKRKIVNFLRLEQPRRVSQVSECFGAGTGCGWCRPFLQKYFDELCAGASPTSEEISREDYARGRSRYVQEGRGTPPPGATPVDPP